MKLRFPPTRYRVVRNRYLGFTAEYRPWWSLVWMECARRGGACGTNTNETLEDARQLCANHARHRHPDGQVVAQFSTRELEAHHNSASSDWNDIVRCADDIESRLRVLLGRMEQDQQEVNHLCELSSRIAESDQTANS